MGRWETGRSGNWTLGIFIMVVLACVALLSGAGGCSSEDVEQYRAVRVEMQAALDQAQAELTAARATIEGLNAQIDAMADGPDKVAAIEARDNVAGLIARAEAAIPELQQGIERADAAIESAIAGDAAGAVGTIGAYVGSKAPPPWNVYILAGTTVLGGILTWWQKREKDKTTAAATSVVHAIEAERVNHSGQVNFADPAVKASLRSSMSTEARKLVEQAKQTF